MTVTNRLTHFVAVSLAVMVVSCQGRTASRDTTSADSVKSRLAEQMKQQKVEPSSTTSYLVRFETAEEAVQHSEAVKKIGGTVVALDSEQRILKVNVAQKSLGLVNIGSDAQITLNTNITLRKPQSNDFESMVSGDDDAAQSFLTTRKVTGVDDLRQRFPTADGRGLKVAVMDTGIDFGIDGLSTKGKLAGFFDLTNFGVTKASSVTIADNQIELSNGAKLSFSNEFKGQKVEFGGVLSEVQLAKDYLAGAGIDLNANGKFGDEYKFLVGETANGQRAVWIDTNGNGVIDNAASEELTDFNSTGKFVPLALANGNRAGSRPLAVSFTQNKDVVQFHSNPGGHATGCGLIIAGDGYANGKLSGMAPKAQLVSYVLDSTGQDVYTLDQYLSMYLHARDQKVDAISLSWGFATADVTSARFVGNFIDKEVASKGIIVAIAAGNEGPAFQSAAPDDYIPRFGYGVGAHLPKDQTRNVYGWTGATEDGIVFYSSYGPTRGGRAMPDLSSPITTLVRKENSPVTPAYYGFSGTSSATPALVGSVTALVSALKQNGETTIDTRLLKLALENTASVVPNAGGTRQGFGLLNVNRAYDLYKKLIGELNAARNDGAHNTSFAYDVRAQVTLPNAPESMEGIWIAGNPANVTVRLPITAESLALLDPQRFFEPVRLVHQADFFSVPDVLTLQATTAAFTVAFDQAKLLPGKIYEDRILIQRASDGLTLAVVPVVVSVPAEADARGNLAQFQTILKPQQLWHTSFSLAETETVQVKLLVQDLGQGVNGRVGVIINNHNGDKVFERLIALREDVEELLYDVPALPKDNYQVVIYRYWGQPAVLSDLAVSGGVRVWPAKVAGVKQDGQKLKVAIQTRYPITVNSAELVLDKTTTKATLQKRTDMARLGFYGNLQFASQTDKALALRIVQSPFDRAIERFAALSVSFLRKDDQLPVYRGWINIFDAGTPGQDIALFDVDTKASYDVIAYPNIVDWKNLQTDSVTLEAETALTAPVTATTTFTAPRVLQGVEALSFDLGEGVTLPANAQGRLVLKASDGKVLAKLPVSL